MAAHPPVRMSCVGPGVNMVGVFSEGTGLGAAGRSTLDVLERRGLPHVVADIDWGGHGVEPVPDTITRLSSLHAMPHSTTVVQMNPDMFGMFVLRYHRRLRYDMMPSVNAIVPFWELPALPAKWLPILRSFDVVLAPSRFVREAVESSMPARSRPLVWEYPQSVTPPEAVAPDRSRWLGDRSDRITFLSTFDIWSDMSGRTLGRHRGLSTRIRRARRCLARAQGQSCALAHALRATGETGKCGLRGSQDSLDDGLREQGGLVEPVCVR